MKITAINGNEFEGSLEISEIKTELIKNECPFLRVWQVLKYLEDFQPDFYLPRNNCTVSELRDKLKQLNPNSLTEFTDGLISNNDYSASYAELINETAN